MNKQYFAKYLPVKGEIKLNDSFFENGKLVENWQNEADLSYINEKSYIKLAKLFLSSRDIQVGDNVKTLDSLKDYVVSSIEENRGNNPDEKKLLKEGVKYWFTFETGGLGTNKNTFKVIGEISPNATWVKEGDEFDENEIGFYWGAGEDSLGYFLIKDPCGHFH